MSCKQAGILSVLGCSLILAAGIWAAPTVFPLGVTIQEEGAEEGYVIFGGRDGNVHLIDADGTDLHTWTFPCGFSYALEPLADGRVMTESCGKLVEKDWADAVAWEYTPPAGMVIHDDWERLAGGNTLILASQTINEPSISSLDTEDEVILEVSPAGSVVWEWHLSDHFGELGFSAERLGMIQDRGGDWAHATSVSTIPANAIGDSRFTPGNILLSLRHQNTAVVIERTTGDIVWITTDLLIGPYDVHMIPSDLPGGERLLALDNGFAGDWLPVPTLEPVPYNRDHSKVWEIDPVTMGLLWRYEDSHAGLTAGAFFTHEHGGAQKLSNGNTLITEAQFGRIFEVTESLEIVWEYLSPFFDGTNGNAIYRAHKLPVAWAGPHFVPDLVVSGESTSAGTGGGELTHTVRIENEGSDPAVGLELTEVTPAKTNFQSISAPAGWSCSTPKVGSSGTISCVASNLSAGSAAVFTIVLGVEPCSGGLTMIDITAAASSIGSDATPGDDSTTFEAVLACL
jgi:uncharacterized repeat protein (TIGR01451 family)